MNVVCIKNFPLLGHIAGTNRAVVAVAKKYPVKGEIYKVLFTLECQDGITRYILDGLELTCAWNVCYFRPTDDTYGHVVTEIIEQQIEYEKVLEWSV
jgi:hypothetical protein